MKRHISAFVLASFLCFASRGRAEERLPIWANWTSRSPIGVDWATMDGPVGSTILVQDGSAPPAELYGSYATEDGGGAIEDEGPAHIRDNAFLVEEAANQEAGVVQHIFTWTKTWDQIPGGRTRDFLFTQTMELPVWSQDHQFSFTTQFLGAFEKPDVGPAANQGGVGDTFLSYRYQLLADDDFLWAAPRASLIIPTGDERFGLGTGELGYQFNLPISRYSECFDFHFNAGLTHVPDVSVPLAVGVSPGQDLTGYNLGGSVFWKPETYLHFFVEALALWNDEIDEFGFEDDTTQVFINPGVRYAVCQLEGCEWVLGVSVPVGLTSDSPDIGVFAYMSIEHDFLRKE